MSSGKVSAKITKEVRIGDGKVTAIVNESRAIATIMTYTF